MKYLELYKKWMEAGKIPASSWPENPHCAGGSDGGLCSYFKNNRLFKHMQPDDKSIISTYWGHGSNLWPDGTSFTPLRQTIVLFMAAMNNEL